MGFQATNQQIEKVVWYQRFLGPSHEEITHAGSDVSIVIPFSDAERSWMGTCTYDRHWTSKYPPTLRRCANPTKSCRIPNFDPPSSPSAIFSLDLLLAFLRPFD